MTSFDVKNFWRITLSFSKVTEAKKQYPFINKVFTNEQLEKGFCTPPYFYYPLSHWLFYQNRSPICKKPLCLLDTQLSTLIESKVTGFDKRLKKLQSEATQESFYSFLSELALAWHFFRHRNFYIEFFDFNDKQKRKPDLKIVDTSSKGKLFIEVYTHFKFYFRLRKLKELLIEIDRRLRIARDLFLQSPPANLNENKLNDIVNEILEKLHNAKIRKQVKTKYQIILFEENNLQIYLQNDGNFKDGNNYDPALIKHGGGKPLDTLKVQLEEIFKDKGSYGQLKEFHPNILAINSLFNEDFQVGVPLRLNQPGSKLQISNVPDFIDMFYLFALGIDSELVDFKTQGNLFWRDNQQDNQNIKHIRKITLT